MLIDLRSDTVTRPTAAMKQAMVDAPLGDDVFGDDPTVNRLEAIAAVHAGKAAAMFVPSGTMANQIAIRLHTQSGDEVLLEAGSHPYQYESGAAGMISGVLLRPLPGRGGILDPAQIEVNPDNVHYARTSLLCVEDTHNRGGGTFHTLEQLDGLAAKAKAIRIASHLDGARGFNAAIASGQPLARRAQGFDTVSFCLSKGLGCPVGSLLCGSVDTIARARRIRKMLGGGMRQVGMLAAAGIYALDHHITRLADDHRRARELSMGLLMAGIDVKLPPTNLIYVDVADAGAVQTGLANQGILANATSPTRVRLVVHLDVDDAAVQQTVRAFEKLPPAIRGKVA